MKTITTMILFVLAALGTCGQSFEGKIIYNNTFKSKTANITNHQLDSMMGTKEDYYIKGGNYLSVTNGALVQWQLYINKDNKMYNKMAASQTILWDTAGIYNDQVYSLQLNKNATTILGYPCDEIILYSSNGLEKYYFNSVLSVDAQVFSAHKYGNWYDLLKSANALPLKVIIDNKQFSLESVATEVAPATLDDKLFQLPANVKIAKNIN